MTELYGFFISNPVIAFIFIAIVFAGFVYLIVRKLRDIGLNKIMAIVYRAFIVAEHRFQYGDNEQKFEYVVNLARSHLPMPFKILITEDLLKSTIQMWFDLCKDLLDDGRINRSKI